MATIITPAQLRAVLGVSSALYDDAYLTGVIDVAENAILPMLVKYNAPIAAQKREDNKLYIYTVGDHPFAIGQIVDITGLPAGTLNNQTIVDVPQPYIFTIASNGSNFEQIQVIPSGKATLDGSVDYATDPNVELAVTIVAVEAFQSRFASGGEIQGLDFQPTTYRIGIGLLSRVKGILGPYLDVGSMVG